VGFIRKLPHHLVESFKSTLEEVKDADLLLHVVDASSPMTQEQIEAVESTLQELGASNTPVQWVFNKIDQATPEQLLECKQQYPQAVYVSAARHMGLDRLRQTVENRLEEDFLEFDLTLPITDFSVVSSLRTLAVIENECYDETSIQISGRTSADILKGLSKKYNGQLNVFDSEGRLQPMDEVHS
jgi:GTP-binding protein HflX